MRLRARKTNRESPIGVYRHNTKQFHIPNSEFLINSFPQSLYPFIPLSLYPSPLFPKTMSND